MSLLHNHTIRTYVPDFTSNISRTVEEYIYQLAQASCGRDKGFINYNTYATICRFCLHEQPSWYKSTFIEIESHFINIGRRITAIRCLHCQRSLTKFKAIIRCDTCSEQYIKVLCDLSDDFYELFDPTTYCYSGNPIYREIVSTEIRGTAEE